MKQPSQFWQFTRHSLLALGVFVWGFICVMIATDGYYRKLPEPTLPVEETYHIDMFPHEVEIMLRALETQKLEDMINNDVI